VQLKDQIGASFETPRLAFDARKRHHAGRPTNQMARRRLGISHVHAVEALLGVFRIPATR
jgi:hypothetical protein